ncbi:MAG: hypothetical protein AAFX93_11065 [Verrucomicrobiota bacterium]
MARKQINVTVEDDLKEEFEAICAEVDMPAGMLLRHAARAIIEFYKENGYISSPLKVVPTTKAAKTTQAEPTDAASPYKRKSRSGKAKKAAS